MSNDVDRAGVATAGQHHQSVPPEVHDEGLIVDDFRVVCPPLARPRLMAGRHAPFELSRPVDFTSDQYALIEEQGGYAPFHHVESLLAQSLLADRGKRLDL